MRLKPVVLAILDGWGHSDSPDKSHNAIYQANTPNLDGWAKRYPISFVDASELHVGLPGGQMGNSEVGHMNIGSGRVVMQDLPRIDTAIADGSLAKHPSLLALVDKLKQSSGVCHLLGLLSPGGVHSHQAHLAALANIIAAHGVPVRIHAFLDGRDTPPQSALDYLTHFQKALGNGDIRIATVSGRYYAMDRDKRWDRVQLAYDALTAAKGEKAADAIAAVKQSYAKSKNDEFVFPTIISDYTGMQDGDGIVMGNFRADRAREILTALLDPNFTDFTRGKTIKFDAALGMVEYSAALNPFIQALFPPEQLSNILGEVVSKAGMKQLRIAETEKYAHVTFFFNGGVEQPFPGETRILVPSPKVATYDLQPEMSAPEVTDKLVEAIGSGQYDLIVVNYANGDMVGHSGDIEAAKKAVEAVDTCLGRVGAALEKTGGVMLITADHGNAESMFDQHSNQPHTAHTLNKVPFTVIGKGFENSRVSDGRLADIAPTVLALLGLVQPEEMTGKSLIHHAGS